MQAKRTPAKHPSQPSAPTRSVANVLTPMPWHHAAEVALKANRSLAIVGPPGSGKTSWVNDYALRHTGMPAFERQGNPGMTESSFWGHRRMVKGDTCDKDGRLAAAIARGGVFVLNDASVVPQQVLSNLLDALEKDAIHNPNTEEVVPVSPSFRIVLTTNRESLRCRQGKATFHSVRSRNLVLHIEEPDSQVLIGILRADFPHMSRGSVERAITNWERYQPLDGKSSDDETFRLSIREAKQYLALLEAGADEATAVRLAFVDKFCHDPETYEAMRLKTSLSGEVS